MKKFLTSFLAIMLFGTGSVQAQCALSGSYYGELLPNNGCENFSSYSPYGPGMYFRMPVLLGGSYSISTCGSPIDTQLSGYQGSTGTNVFYVDDNGPFCTGTASSATYVPTFTDYLRVQVSQYNCLPGGSTSITVQVRQNNNLAFTSSAADMCEGQTRTLSATPAPVPTAQANSGNLGTFSGTGVSGTTFTAPTPAGASASYTLTYTFGYCSTTQNITVYRAPTTANAGPDQTVCATTTTLAGNVPTYGTGTWSVVSGPGTVTTPGSPTSAVTGLTSATPTVLRWTIVNGPCTTSTDDVVITMDSSPTTANAGADQVLNCSATTTTLAGNTPVVGTGTWTLVSGSGTLTSPSSPGSGVTGLGIGLNTFRWSITNGTCPASTDDVVVSVSADVTSPVADMASLPTLTGECSVTPTAPTATDNCAGSIPGTPNISFPVTAQGTTTITWTYNDGNGNSTLQTQNVVIDDVTAPVANVGSLPDVTAECSVSSLTAPTATDNCAGTVTGTHNASLPITAQGTTVVTWTYNDGNGNTSTQTQNVVIDDVTAPVPDVASLADVTAECSVTSLTAPTATDNCGGSVTVTNDAVLPITTQGTTVVTWTYQDANGNTSTQTQNVVLDDVTAPTAVCQNISLDLNAAGTTSLTPGMIDGGSTDNCGIASMILSSSTFSCADLGPNIVTMQVTDYNGNWNNCLSTVTILDITAPVSDLLSLADITAECSVSSLTAPTATDNCAGTVTGTHNASLPITAQGTTVVTWTYDDGNGNTSTQAQNVVIDDVTAPVADVASLSDVTAECAVMALTAPTATDNCVGTVTGTHNASLPITAQGTTVVTWTYDDGNGNTSTQAQNVVIDDVTAPVADVASLSDVTAECSVSSLTAPTATDNCAGTVTGTHNASLPITAQGTTVVTWTYDDGNGNTSTQAQNVVIDDVTAPVADVASLSDVTAECSVSSLTAPTATDNCAGTVTGTHNASLPITAQGTTVVTWTYDDGNGNTSTQAQNVVIDDVTAPVADIASLSDVTAECAVMALTAPTATDNCVGTVSGTHNASLPITAQGTTVVTWTYDDGNGNTSTQAQNVVIDDVTAPVADVASLTDVTAECSVSSLTAPTATDNCTGTVTGTHNASLPITAQGTTVVTWTYDDGNGNTSTQTQNVVIDDVTAPVADVASLSDVTAECAVTALTAPTATDNCVGTVSGTHNASLPITAQGTTVVTWTYDDGNGNTSTQTQNVVIDDVTAPVADVASLSDVTAECAVTALTAPTATDNCAGTVTGTHNASLPITAQGTTVVTWTYDDGNGNTSTQAQNVVIDDVTAPVADVASLSDVAAQCAVTALTAPTATDNCAGTVSGTHNASLPITAQGTTVVTWTYDDGNGNTSTQTQNVVIDDVTAPVADVASLSDVTAECSVSSLTAPTATDNCVGTVSGTHNASLPITAQGTTVVTWTYDDGNGNTSTQTQNVVIDDVTAPVADVTSLADVTAECSVSSLTAPTATDNCAGTVSGTHNASLPITAQGTTVVTWTYDDGNGNTSTQAQNVVIDDVTAPVADVASLSDVTAECSVSSLTAPTATDNCVGTVSGTHNASLPITAQGTTVVTWTYDDGNGNTSTQTQNVVIDDVTAPVADVASLSDVTAECAVMALTAPTATDNCVGTVTGTHNASLPITAQGTTVVTWTYDDGNGNTSTQTQNVVIDDVTAPVADVTSLADVTAECSVSSLTAPTATDNCAGTVSGTHNASLPITAQGTTVVTWTYDDGNGNTSTQTQNVVIDDVTAPVPDLASLADVTAECEVTSLTAPTATDNCAGTVSVTNDAVLPITVQGTTVVTWTYDDGNGNTSTQSQNIVIDDVTAPDVPILLSLSAECSVTVLAPVTTDNCAGFVTGTTTDPLTYSAEGIYTITWTFDDGNGNTSFTSQTVIIDDATAPVPDVASLTDITVECEVTSLTAPTATDNCAGAVTVTNDAVLPITAQGTTVVTWTYDDGNGNTSAQTQNVVINDVTAPVPDAAILSDVVECFEATPVAPTATDNCGGMITGTPDVTFPIITAGTTVVTWTYDDGNGNTVTQIQNVSVNTVDASVTENGGTLTANESGIGYQWLDCDNGYAIIAGATAQSFTPVAITGNYAVEVSAAGCTDTSDCYLVDFTGLDEQLVSQLGVNLYPNPNHGVFTVSVNNLKGEDLSFEVRDNRGRLVQTSAKGNVNGTLDHQLDISGEESGVYFLRVTANGVQIGTLSFMKE